MVFFANHILIIIIIITIMRRLTIEGRGIMFPVISLSFHPSFCLSIIPSITSVSHDTISLLHLDFNENWHKYSSFEWKLMKTFSKSEIKVQNHMCTNV